MIKETIVSFIFCLWILTGLMSWRNIEEESYNELIDKLFLIGFLWFFAGGLAVFLICGLILGIIK